MEVLNLKGATLVRFVTTTHGWAERVRNNVCVPDKFPYMIVELLVGADDMILMSTAVGVPKATLSALSRQGLYRYEMEDLPGSIVTAVESHFTRVYRELLKRTDVFRPTDKKPRLSLVKPSHITSLVRERQVP